MTPEREAAASTLLRSIDEKRNLPLGIAAGLVGALIGAAIWAAVTASTHYQIGFMAIGVAYLVGFGMSRFGNGRTPLFGYVGGAIALLGSLIGNVAVVYVDLVTMGGVEASKLASIPPSDVSDLFVRNSNAMDLLFYGIAAYFGYRYSIRRPTKEEIAALPA